MQQAPSTSTCEAGPFCIMGGTANALCEGHVFMQHAAAAHLHRRAILVPWALAEVGEQQLLSKLQQARQAAAGPAQPQGHCLSLLPLRLDVLSPAQPEASVAVRWVSCGTAGRLVMLAGARACLGTAEEDQALALCCAALPAALLWVHCQHTCCHMQVAL